MRSGQSVDAVVRPQKLSAHTLIFRSLKQSHDFFLPDSKDQRMLNTDETFRLWNRIRIRDDYGPEGLAELEECSNRPKGKITRLAEKDDETKTSISDSQIADSSTEIVRHSSSTIVPRKPTVFSGLPRPVWHRPWKLYRVISGHLGWVRCIDVEPGNEWFATGSADRMIKIWDLASGNLKLSLTGHVSTVRGIAVSERQPYLFSAGEDKQVKCWDLEANKVVRHYHGHLSAIYALALHPTLDVLVTCGRDAVARLWDMRTKAQIHCLTGHISSVADVKCQSTDPQIITGSHDSTIRLWDIVAGRTMCTLTHHKKSVRSIVLHPDLLQMASGSPDNIKQWNLPDGQLVQNFSGHDAIVNSLAVNEDGVLVSGGDNGSMRFWDWATGYNFQRLQTKAQPGSIDPEMGIFALSFDKTGTRLISCEADKTIKLYKEDDDALEEDYPIVWKPDVFKNMFKRFNDSLFTNVFRVLKDQVRFHLKEPKPLRPKRVKGDKSTHLLPQLSYMQLHEVPCAGAESDKSLIATLGTIKPSKFLLVIFNEKSTSGHTFYIKDALKSIGFELRPTIQQKFHSFQPKSFKKKRVIVANTANNCRLLWLVKHLITVVPITFPDGMPTIEHLGRTHLDTWTGEFRILPEDVQPEQSDRRCHLIDPECQRQVLYRKKIRNDVNSEYFPTIYQYRCHVDWKGVRIAKDISK
ncbi:hypothetical protein ACOME3_007041 [Neoechinorhynchus agilis]